MQPTAGGSERPVPVVPKDDAAASLAALARERDAALAALNAERERTLGAMRQCDYLASEIMLERRRHEAHTASERARQIEERARELEDLDARLRHANATIDNMERSWFWKSRLVWVRIRSLGRFKASPPGAAD